jgi:hypothetical protein
MLSYFVIVFWLIFFNAGQLISAVVAACCCYHRGEKWLVNSVTFLYFVGSGSAALAAWQHRWQRQQHGSCSQLCSGGDSLVEAQF